jgi:hypothetical protein
MGFQLKDNIITPGIMTMNGATNACLLQNSKWLEDAPMLAIINNWRKERGLPEIPFNFDRRQQLLETILTRI